MTLTLTLTLTLTPTLALTPTPTATATPTLTRYTGYNGSHVWEAIYKENCLVRTGGH